MTILNKDTALESELQELYILAGHWLRDVEFITEELGYFKNLQAKYGAENDTFKNLVIELEQHLSALKKSIPDFLNLLTPFFKDQKRLMDLKFLENYNQLRTGIQIAFDEIKKVKRLLFAQVI